MDTRLDTPYLALRFGIGLTAALAGVMAIAAFRLARLAEVREGVVVRSPRAVVA